MSPQASAGAISTLLGWILFSPFLLGMGCTTTAPRPASTSELERACAIIETDDDIPSGSASAGALYVENAALGKRLLTADVVATARGFLDGGIPCVQVIDSHDGAIDPVPLKKFGVPVLTPSNSKEWTWPFLGPLRRRAKMAALIGFHSPAGARGFRPHTINDSIRALWVNGEVVGEVAHLILGLAALDVPVVLISGDMNATAEAAAWIPPVAQITVRWLGADGKPRFLSAAKAASRLYLAARQAAQKNHQVYRPQLPLRIALEIASARLLKDRSRKLAQTYRSEVANRPQIKRVLGFDFEPSMRATGHQLSWKAENALAAFVSIAFAASYLRGTRNWERVSEGYSAYIDGRYHAALLVYQQVLKQNPYDTATSCRLAAVYHKLSVLDEARKHYAFGVEHLDEIGDSALKTWCLLGLAEVEFTVGHLAEAKRAALRVLQFPDLRDRHRAATILIDKIEGKSPPERSTREARRAEFTFITNRLETVYSYLSHKQERYHFSYAALKTAFGERIEQVATAGEYQAEIKSFLERFHDGHLRLQLGEQTTAARRLPPAVTHKWLPGRVLVTHISRLWGDEDSIQRQLRRGLKLLGRARALVVDLRGNDGGNDALIFDYISRLVAKDIPLGLFSLRMSREVMKERPHYKNIYQADPARPGFSRWRASFVAPKTKRSFPGPVAVLVDKDCYSSCEGAALAFKNSGIARLYGQKTGGGSANPLLISLPTTAGKLMIPTWIQIMPDGDLLEDNGVPPDVLLPRAEDALTIALQDIQQAKKTTR